MGVMMLGCVLALSTISASCGVIVVKLVDNNFGFKAPDFFGWMHPSGWFLDLTIMLLIARWAAMAIKMPTKREWRNFAILGLLGGVDVACRSYAIVNLPGTTYTLLRTADTIFVVVMSRVLFRGHRPKPLLMHWLGVTFIVGTVLFNAFDPNTSRDSKENYLPFGTALALTMVSSFMSSLQSVVADWLVKKQTNQIARAVSRTESDDDSDASELVFEDPLHDKALIDNIQDSSSDEEVSVVAPPKSLKSALVGSTSFAWPLALCQWITLGIWAAANREWEEWPDKFAAIDDEKPDSMSVSTARAAFGLLILLMVLARVGVRFSKTYIVLDRSAVFFTVFKPMRRGVQLLLTFVVLGEEMTLFKGLSAIAAAIGFCFYTYGEVQQGRVSIDKLSACAVRPSLQVKHDALNDKLLNNEERNSLQ